MKEPMINLVENAIGASFGQSADLIPSREFNAAVKDAKPGEPVMLLVRRGEQTSFVTVTPSREDEANAPKR